MPTETKEKNSKCDDVQISLIVEIPDKSAGQISRKERKVNNKIPFIIYPKLINYPCRTLNRYSRNRIAN